MPRFNVYQCDALGRPPARRLAKNIEALSGPHAVYETCAVQRIEGADMRLVFSRPVKTDPYAQQFNEEAP